MEKLTPADPGYDEARGVFNVAIDSRPAIIARCASPADVVEALNLARERRLDVAVRSGGHSVAGLSTNVGGLVVDVRPMNRIEVDPDRRTMRVGSGATWGDIDVATQAHGLAVTGGRSTSTGVAGFTLGGGDGWLARAFGLACDNLIAVDLVTADGREVRASESENAELFWALHGGGGNFGVATALEFRLHPLGPEIHAGLAFWSLADPQRCLAVAQNFRDLLANGPHGLGGGILSMNDMAGDFAPEHLVGKPLLALAIMYAGDPREGRDLVAPLVEIEPDVNLLGEMTYVDFQEATTDPPGHRHYWSTDYHDSFSDAAMSTFIDSCLDRPSPLDQQVLFAWGGAISEVSEDATPMTHRQTPWVTHPFAVWEDPSEDEANREWVRTFRRAIAEHTNGGVYLNFIGREGQDRVRAAFGESKYRRLQAVKSEYDPQNVFRGNQNIVPG